MITAPLPRASPSGTGRLSMIIPRYYGLTITNYIPPPLIVQFLMTRSVRYQPILHTLYYTLHTEHAYCLSYRFLNNVVTTTIVEMVEILDGRLGKHSVELVRYVINNLLHLVIVKYGDISLILCISTRLRLVTILSLLVKYLVVFHADPCNKSYVIVINHMRGLYGIYKSRDTRANPEWQGFMNRVQTERWFITIL